VTTNATTREKHRRAGADRDRAHVGPHQPADERHRQHRGDHGESGKNRRVADLVDGFNCDLQQPLAPAAREAQVADDVLHDHDRVVDEDADREDQREKRDAVERVTVEVENKERQPEGHGDRQEHDERFAPAEEQQDQHGHAEDRDPHVQQQLVGFFRGGRAVVARDGDADIGRDERALEAINPGQHGADDIDRVRARPLGHAEGDGRLLAGRTGAALAEQHVVGRFVCAVDDRRDVPKINRPPLGHADDRRADIARIAEEGAGLQQRFPVGGGLRAGVGLGVGLLQHRHEVPGAEIAGGELLGIQHHAHGAVLAADQRRFGHEGNLLHRVIHLRSEPAQRGVIVARAVEGEGEDRHVVDRAGLDERRGDAERDAVEVRLQLLVEADEGGLEVRADLEPHDGQVAAGACGGVEVFDTGDFPKEFLHRARDAVLHLGRRRTGHRHHHVDHRHLDLRLLLARQHEDREKAEEQRGGDDDRRQLGVDEQRGQAARDPGLRGAGQLRRSAAAHGCTSSAWPSRKPAGGAMITRSPSSRPARISTESPRVAPDLTSRSTPRFPSPTTNTRSIWPSVDTARAGANRLFTGAPGICTRAN
jgi:hypothetical protein